MRPHLYLAIVTTMLINIGGAVAQQVPGDTVLVDGTPPLTESMVERYAGLATWILDIPLTQSVWEKEREFLIRYWVTNNKLEIGSVVNNLKEEALFAAMSEGERDMIREQAQANVLKDLQSQLSSEEARFLLSLYEMEHPEGAVALPPEPSTSAADHADLWKKHRSGHGYGPGSVPSVSRELMKITPHTW